MRTYPSDFRSEETNTVLDAVRRARSVSVIGTASVGKSNFVQHLMALMSKTDSNRLLPVLLDANLLPVMSEDESIRCWAGHELIMHRLYVSAYPFTMLDRDADVLFQTYQRLQDGRNPLYAHMGVRYLELALNLFFVRGYQIVLIFDEFEAFMQMMPPQFFLNLRGLRDMHKAQLSYVTFSRTTLSRLCSRYQLESDTIEPFVELFNDSQQSLGPYTFRDAQLMLQNLTPTIANHIYSVTGGFAGLMRACVEVARVSKTSFPSQTIQTLLADRGVRSECEILVRAFDDDERDVIRHILRGTQLSDSSREAAELLITKQLLTPKFEIQPPLLAAYLTSYDL